MKNFSEKYYKDSNLTPQQHKANNEWFAKMVEECKLHREKLYVSNIRIWFDCDGNEIKADYFICDFVSKK